MMELYWTADFLPTIFDRLQANENPVEPVYFLISQWLREDFLAYLEEWKDKREGSTEAKEQGDCGRDHGFYVV